MVLYARKRGMSRREVNIEKVLMRGQDMDRIFEKFWLRGGGEGYFAGDVRGWGATPSLVHA
nr:MAG TPA: hypothetical protein [Caudoviricetes sp.]